jgi:hypothetical protein
MSLVNPLLGVVELELEPLTFDALFATKLADNLILRYLQNAGGFAAIGVMVWIITSTLRAPKSLPGVARQAPVSKWMWACFLLGIVLYVGALVMTIFAWINRPEAETMQLPDGTVVERVRDMTKGELLAFWLTSIAGLFALMAFMEPFVRDLFKYRGRRIWALAKLSFKEAVRRKVVWVFLAFLLLPMFPAKWFFRGIKPEYELNTHINNVDFGMSLLLVFVALVSAFAIPGDIKSQTIHTIVTKPVERFEIVLGRILGYLGLLTVALFGMCTVTLLLIETSNVDEAARAETMKARVPLYGELNWFSQSQGDQFQGVNVGREREYRRYLTGNSSERANFNFPSLPSRLGRGDAVPVEFAFDIFRTSKGDAAEENRGIAVGFEVETWKWSQDKAPEFEREIYAAFQATNPNLSAPTPTSRDEVKQRWQKMNEICEKYGRFVVAGKAITDYHTERFDIPAGIFRNALDGTPPTGVNAQGEQTQKPRLVIRARCITRSQLIGVARRDLYILESEGSFWLNFYKGAVGLWCRLSIVVVIAVACSTYLLGVISFLIAAFLYLGASFREFIQSLAAGTNIGGGPLESFTRLARGDTPAAQLEKVGGMQVAAVVDEGFRWVVRRLLSILPDKDQFDWFPYVSQGFSIRPEDILLSLIALFAYLLPWGVLAYYFMRSREIAA